MAHARTARCPRAGRHPALLAERPIGPLTLHNRMIVTAMGVSLAEPDGHVPQRLIDCHVAQAAGSALEKSDRTGGTPCFTGLAYEPSERLLAERKEHGVAMFAGARAIAIGGNVVRVVDGKGAERRVAAENAIVTAGARGLAVRAYGDATGISCIEGAMRGAAEAVAAG